MVASTKMNTANFVMLLIFSILSLSSSFIISKPEIVQKLQISSKLYGTETSFQNKFSHKITLFSSEVEEDEFGFDEMVDEDARVVTLSENALKHLAELKTKQGKAEEENLMMRMGVKSGGCSGMSYVLDFMEESEITEEDHIEEWEEHKLKCAIDPKSLLYLYGLQLDYSDELIGGGFEFRNPNAEQTCGCGKSFGV
eukprot:CAMPEP_0117756854 /NCGR_PEP_ID=MMETSP0947-20121206/14351_1 /TAXON_ID=44440 /ORGANISM="Chattonella subsalsa, Strain CCMP2191" /LENGTH=196 /DNA_ID=CAMNT_0005576571 /DNA_START=60 /DNA_END=650 /DNA_ORIENTATION=-